MSIKLLSINIEGNKHQESVLEFIEKERPDVVLMMECFEDKLSVYANGFSNFEFLPNYILDQKEDLVPGNRKWGEVIMSNHHLSNISKKYCNEWEREEIGRYPNERHMASYLFASVETDEGVYRIGTTHFTITPHASVTDEQKQDMQTMLRYLEGEGEFVLAGDFNMPRGNEVYKMIAREYKDNIPENV